MTANTIHTCSYYCERPGCIRAQRDELRDRLEALTSAPQPVSAGEEIMVNAAHGVFTLPLQPSGLSSGPRFVVHVPAPEQKFKVGDRVVACETFYHDEVQGIRVGAYGTVRESRYNGEIFLVDFDGITPSKCVNEHDGAWEMFAHQLELAPDTRHADLAPQQPASAPAGVDEAAAIRAFEEHFQASSDDPYFEGELELWLTAWRKALAAQQPAAVDEARSVSSIMDGAVSFVEALAAQHQEPKS